MTSPQTKPRSTPYLYATWIPRYLTGEKSCLFAAWFKANHQGYAKMPSDFNSAKWNMEHTDLLNELVEELEERGCQIFIERQNPFKVESARSGVVVGGTAGHHRNPPRRQDGDIRRQDRPGVAIAHCSGAALHVSAAQIPVKTLVW